MTVARMNLELAERPSARIILVRIRGESRDEAEKGRWFERLFMRVALQEPEFEIKGIWRRAEWPERETLTGLDGRDIGIDLMARRTSGEWVAIQCKRYDDRHVLGKSGIDKFLGDSQQPVFRLRWVMATCSWGPNAKRAIQIAHPEIRQIDFRQYLDIQVKEQGAKRPAQEPWPLQADAIDSAPGRGGIRLAEVRPAVDRVGPAGRPDDQPRWRRSAKIPRLRQPHSCTPQCHRLTPVAMMISSRAGRISSSAFAVTIVPRALRRPLCAVPPDWTRTISPSAFETWLAPEAVWSMPIRATA